MPRNMPSTSRIITNTFKPTNTSCAPRETCMSGKYCAPNTKYNPQTKVCEPKK